MTMCDNTSTSPCSIFLDKGGIEDPRKSLYFEAFQVRSGLRAQGRQARTHFSRGRHLTGALLAGPPAPMAMATVASGAWTVSEAAATLLAAAPAQRLTSRRRRPMPTRQTAAARRSTPAQTR